MGPGLAKTTGVISRRIDKIDELIDAKVTLRIGRKEQRHIELNMCYERAELGIIKGAEDEGTWIDLEPFQARMLATFLIDKWIPHTL